MESVGKHLDELTEIHTPVGDVIEYRLVAVALVFHIAYFHLQSETLCYLAALDHGIVFAGFRLVVLVHIHCLCDAIDALYLVSRLEVGFLYLQFHESSGECHHSDVVSRTCFHCHNVAFFQLDIVHIVVISLSCVLELHLHEVGVLFVSGYIVQPVVGVVLLVLPSASAVTQSAVGVAGYFEFHVFEVFHKLCML